MTKLTFMYQIFMKLLKVQHQLIHHGNFPTLQIRKVHKKGYREGTAGKGTQRSITDGDFETSLRALKDCGWEVNLNAKQQQQLEEGKIPKDVRDKLNVALKVPQGLELFEL